MHVSTKLKEELKRQQIFLKFTKRYGLCWEKEEEEPFEASQEPWDDTL